MQTIFITFGNRTVASLRWFAKQIYVTTSDSTAAAKAKAKVNKKGGTTLSPMKLGGWDVAYALAQELGSWPTGNKQSKTTSA